MPYVSGIIGAFIYGELNSPKTQIFEWDIRETSSPIGVRHIYGGHPAWVKELGVAPNKAMQFEDVVIDFSNSQSGIYTSRTQCFTIGLFNDNFSISNLRLWMPSGTAISVPSAHIEYAASGTWITNAILPSGYGTTISTSLPTNLNILRQDDLTGNLDFNSDSHTSQFVYLSLTVPSGIQLGQYGIGINGDISFRITYDWYYKFQSSGSMT